MSPRNYSLVTALIFALIALLQLIRSVGGWPVTLGTMSIPLWASWAAFIVAALLAWLGFQASRV